MGGEHHKNPNSNTKYHLVGQIMMMIDDGGLWDKPRPNFGTLNHEKVKVCHGTLRLVIIEEQRSIKAFTQFEATIWAKQSTQWQWNKLLKVMTLEL